jgi:hypothetical protein
LPDPLGEQPNPDTAITTNAISENCSRRLSMERKVSDFLLDGKVGVIARALPTAEK